MSTIIRELLIFASMKKDDVDTQIINIKEIIENVRQRLRYQIGEKNAKIIIHENISDSKGYAPWVEEVFFNYISNALKYGGVPPIIEIYSEKQPGGIKDNGEGISDDLKAVIFDEKGKRSGLTKGFGLGLSIVRRIIEKLDGTVAVESECGVGSIFSFSLKE